MFAYGLPGWADLGGETGGRQMEGLWLCVWPIMCGEGGQGRGDRGVTKSFSAVVRVRVRTLSPSLSGWRLFILLPNVRVDIENSGVEERDRECERGNRFLIPSHAHVGNPDTRASTHHSHGFHYPPVPLFVHARCLRCR